MKLLPAAQQHKPISISLGDIIQQFSLTVAVNFRLSINISQNSPHCMQERYFLPASCDFTTTILNRV